MKELKKEAIRMKKLERKKNKVKVSMVVKVIVEVPIKDDMDEEDIIDIGIDRFFDHPFDENVVIGDIYADVLRM
jgi:hypothetical protein